MRLSPDQVCDRRQPAPQSPSPGEDADDEYCSWLAQQDCQPSPNQEQQRRSETGAPLLERGGPQEPVVVMAVDAGERLRTRDVRRINWFVTAATPADRR